MGVVVFRGFSDLGFAFNAQGMRDRMAVSEQVRNLERHAADIADLRGQHQKPMCGSYTPRHYFLPPEDIRVMCRCIPIIPDGSQPYLKH